MRARFLSLALILAGMAAQAETGADTITIAVRTDARPMAWKDGRTGHYRGYLWQLCLEAATRARYRHIETVDLTSQTRAEFLGSLAAPPALLKDVDIICDPMTLTQDRLARLTETTRYRPSPIVFVASSSFAQFSRISTPVEGEGGDIRSCPREEQGEETSGIGGRLDQMQAYVRLWPEKQRLREEYHGRVRATTRDTPPETSGPQVRICNVIYSNHADLARDFCAGRLDRYYGDIEIVRGAIESEAERTGKACDARFPAITGNTPEADYEPYVLLISQEGDLHAKISQALYSMFADGTIEKRLSAEFPDKDRWSPALQWLIAINRIPAGQATPPGSGGNPATGNDGGSPH